MDMDNSVVIAGGGSEEVEEGTGWSNCDGRLDLGWRTHNTVYRWLWQTPASRVCVWWVKTKQMHRLQQSCGEKGKVWYSLKMRVLRPLSQGESARPLPGQAFIVFLGFYIKEGFIIYYIEYCYLHFRYNQRNENNKCRRERWRAD